MGIVHTDEELLEVIQHFDMAEWSKTLLIIDPWKRIEHIKQLRSIGDYDFTVSFVQPGEKHTGERKAIYLRGVFDGTAKDFVEDNASILVFFE